MQAQKVLVKMFDQEYFSICDLDRAMGLVDRKMDHEAENIAQLRRIHCVHWEDLGDEYSRKVKENCLEMCGLSVELLQPPPPPAVPSTLSRIDLWLTHWFGKDHPTVPNYYRGASAPKK